MELKPGYKLTEVGVIPEDWSVARLDSITDPRRPISYGIVQTGHLINNGVRCVRVVDIENGRINPNNLITTSNEISDSYRRTVLQEGDLVIALRGKIGELARVDSGLVGANLTRGVAILSQNEAHDSKYLLHYLSSPISKRILERNLNGSALQEIPIATLRRIPAVIPSLAEQRAIAGALSDVDALIGALDQLLAKKRDLKQAAMQQLLTGHQRLPGFAGEWRDWKFGELFQFLKTGNNPRSDLFEVGDVGYVHYGDIHTHPSAFLDCRSVQLPRISRTKVNGVPFLEDGDIVMVDASEDYVAIGKWVEVRNASDREIVAGLHTFLLRGDKTLVADGFKGYIQFLPSVKPSLVRLATGISVYGVSKSNVKTIAVSLPPLAEQTAIAEVLSDMDAELAALEQKRDKTRLLKQGMMQELLTGRTRLI